MTKQTKLTISFPGISVPDTETTWGQFVVLNRDDPDMVLDVAGQIAEHNYARIGGGASPEIWVFA